MKKIIFALMVLLMIGSALAVVGPSVPPEYLEGNPTCEDIGYDNEFKVDPPNAGTYNNGTISLVINNMVDWSSTFEMGAVIVKGGPNANVYYYDTATGDTNLVTPTNPNNDKPYGLSHVSFCWNEPEVPEFGVIAATLGIVGALGIVLYRRRQ